MIDRSQVAGAAMWPYTLKSSPTHSPLRTRVSIIFEVMPTPKA